jgi:hypothetical protein
VSCAAASCNSSFCLQRLPASVDCAATVSVLRTQRTAASCRAPDLSTNTLLSPLHLLLCL